MTRAIMWSLLVFVGLVVLSYLATGGRLTFGLFILPLGLIPLIFGRKNKG